MPDDADMTIRKATLVLLQERGYSVRLVETDISDPFTWTMVGRKDNYEITVSEKCWNR